MPGRFIFVIQFLLIALPGFADRWKVDQQGDLRSISKAIELANPHDTLLVAPGIYREGNIIIDKPLVIIGIDFPVIDGERKVEIFTIKAHDVTLSGFKIINTGVGNMEDIAAVNAVSVKRLKVLNNQLENTFFGIHLTGSSHCLVEGNTILSETKAQSLSGNGIHLWKCDSSAIRHNRIAGHRDGIYFEFVTNTLIENNHSHNNLRYGLHFMFSNDDEYRNNTFQNNGAGVAVMFTKGVRMFNNTFADNWGASVYGILLKEISDCQITGNKFHRNTMGLYLEGVSRGKITDNDFRANGWAIKMQASSITNTFAGNNFFNNTFDVSTNGSVMENEILGNYWDKYEGYDLDRNGVGDVPFYPVSLYSMIVEKMPTAIMLWRSFLVFLLDRTEKLMPVVTPLELKDSQPRMNPYDRG